MLKKNLQKYVIEKKIAANSKEGDWCMLSVLTSIMDPSFLSELSAAVFDNDFVSIMKDEDLVSSINAFFASNLNISETSKQSFLHRNTLVYRLDKVEKLTGYNLRDFCDATSFKLLMQIYVKTGEK